MVGEFPDDSVVRTPVLSLPQAQVQSLVGELKFHKLRGTAKKRQWILWRPVVLKETVLVDTRAKGEADLKGVRDAGHCGFNRVGVAPHSLLNRVGSSP